MECYAYVLIGRDLQDAFLSEEASVRTMSKAWFHLYKIRTKPYVGVGRY